MNKFKSLTAKEKAEYITILILYPFMLLFGWMGKTMKLFGTRRRQIIASALSFALILAMFPIGALTAFADSDVTTASVVDPSTYNNPVLGTGLDVFKRNQFSPKSVYYGEYPQDTSSATNMQPIKWDVWVTDQSIHSSNGTNQVYTYSCDGAIGLVSEKVLDTAPWIQNISSKWKAENANWVVSYNNSALNSFLSGTFLPRAFTTEEIAAMSTQHVITYGGRYHTSLGGRETPTESIPYKVYAPCAKNDKLFASAPATTYAASKGVPTYVYGGVTYGTYWARTIPASQSNVYFYWDGVVRTLGQGYIYTSEARKNIYGVRPLTRVLGDEILLASAVGAKNNDAITNAEAPQASKYEYKLTVRDSTRNFLATQSSISYSSNSINLSVSYTGARIGADEAISYIITDKNDNIYQYKRVKTSTFAAGSINLNIPYSSFLGDRIKVKVFNEQIRGEKYTDYGSPFSTLEVKKPHEHSWETKWTYDQAHHWHECTALDCEATNAEKDGYGAHSFTEETVKPEALKTRANATDAAVYYKSCSCGAVGTTETFSYGNPSEHVHDDGVYFDKLDSAFSGGTLAPGYYYLDSNITLTELIKVSSGTVHLCLNGHTIQQTANGTVVNINKAASMNLYDCSDNHAGCISGNPESSGVYTSGINNEGTFVMNGGTITNNTTAHGGAVYTTGTFVMNGGVISNNHCRVDGGGVAIYNGGSFTMNGGTISGNKAGGVGGGVSIGRYTNYEIVSGSSFTMNGGTISGNVSGPYGGGVYVESSGRYVMNGGLITGNICSYTDTGSGGGGVFASSISNEIVKVGGAATIINNFFRRNGVDSLNNLQLSTTKISILDGFSGKIGMSVFTNRPPTKEAPINMTNNHSVDYSRYFFSDKDEFEVVNIGSGSAQSLQLAVMHDHEWPDTWNSDGTHHWHECTRTGCTVTDTKQEHVFEEGTQISAPTYFADGQRIDTCICGETKTVILPKLIDSIAPTGDITIGTSSVKKVLNTITFGLFFKDTQKVTITSFDAESGVKSTQYYLSTAILDETVIKSISSWKDYTGPISLNPNDKYVVYVKITDNQNNVTYLGSDGITIDSVAPVISGIENGNTYCVSAQFTVAEDNLDKVEVNGTAINPVGGKYTLTACGKNEVVVTDKASNSTTVTVTINATHTYDNACDTTCNVCGGVRTITHSWQPQWSSNGTNHWHECSVCGVKKDEAAHTYDNACDTTCNVCGAQRSITHSWQAKWSSDGTNHWHECSVCHVKKDEAAHTYDNACNTTCNVCGAVRSITHSWQSQWSSDGTNHWHECSVCGVKKDEAAHTYDNACDTTCNVCGAQRSITHSWQAKWSSDGTNHWHECSVCQAKRDEAAHIYDNDCDTTCNICGAQRSITHSWQSQWSSDGTNHWHECSVCGVKKDEAAHTPEVDDGDCTTPVHCSVCKAVITPAQSHNFSEDLQHDADGHWHECTHTGCTVTDTKQEHVWAEGTPNPAPTYFADGERIDTCICGETKTVVLPKLIDSIAPTGDITIGTSSVKKVLNTITFGLFFKDTQTIEITANDAQSGVKSTQYYLSTAILDENAIKSISSWVDYTSPISMNPNDKYVVYVKITDNLNNVTYLGSNGITIDSVIPVISGIENGETYCVSAQFTVAEDNLDTVIVNGTAINPVGGKYTLTACGKNEVVVTDKASNSTTVTVTINATHTYDNACDTTCNVCGAQRSITHSWQAKWSSDGTNHWHECSVCHVKKDEAAHTPEVDDGDCTTPVHCSVCKAVITPAQSHDFSEDLQHDADGHWHECTSAGCTVIDTKQEHVWAEGTPNPAPTYFADGERIDTCTCGKTKTVVLPKLIDSIAPIGTITVGKDSWNSFFNGITFGLFFKDTQSVKVTSDDAESGVDNTYYYLSDKELTETEAKNITEWTEFNGSFSINPNNSYIVYVKITDKVGNSSIINTDGVVLDNIVPTVSGVTDGKIYCAAVTVTVTDDNLETVKLDGKTITFTDGKFMVSPANKAQTITVTDKAGNEKSVSITVNSNHVWDDGIVTDEPTASKKGVKTYTCTHCGDTKTEEISMLAPTVIEGQNGNWKPDGSGTLSFRSDAAFSDFISVLVNGKVINREYYDLKEGSIIVTLKADYLATLPAGIYTLGIQSSTGIALADFTVEVKADDKAPSKPEDVKSPQTGDNSNMLLWLALMLVSVGTLAIFRTKRKRQVK